MKPNTSLVIDVWEGSMEIDEPTLKAAGVAGFVIRLNDINGGHHKDKEFDRQWREAAAFARAPYFVFNPWVDGKANFDWLLANCPAEAKTVFIDIEVRYEGITPGAYASEVVKFLALAQAHWRTPIYTGQGFIDILSAWPKWVEYWWAQYPTSIPWATLKTWDELKTSLDKLDVPFNKQFIPGILRMWQCSGDKVVLPGTLRTTDINIFYGTEAELRAWFGGTAAGPDPDPEPGEDITAAIAAINVKLNTIQAEILDMDKDLTVVRSHFRP